MPTSKDKLCAGLPSGRCADR